MLCTDHLTILVRVGRQFGSTLALFGLVLQLLGEPALASRVRDLFVFLGLVEELGDA